MTYNRLLWTVAAIGTALILLVQYDIRTLIESSHSLETIPLLPGILHLTYLRSTAAFNRFGDVKPLLFLIRIGSILFIAALTFVISWRLSQVGKEMMKSLQVGVGLFLAGAISNTVEHILFNENAVFIDFRGFRVPVFNLADIFIYVGLLISVISILFLGIQFVAKQWQR
jgi:signal peptidase II